MTEAARLLTRDRPHGGRPAAVFWIALSIGAFVAFAVVATWLGADANWDLRNYHLYAPYAAVNDRIQFDHHPAGVQSYINPTLDLLLTMPLLLHGTPTLLSAVIGGLQGLNFVLLAGIALWLLRGFDRPRLLAALAAMLGMTGSLVVSEIGTTFGDLTTATLVLLALLCCLHALAGDDQAADWRWIVAGGASIGLATGLKLTNAVFLAGLLGALGLAVGRRRFQAVLVLTSAAFCGVVLAHGWWSWQLWAAFHNPIFPFFNGIFHSPFFELASFADDRFKPLGPWQALAYPLFFSWNHQTAEVRFVDFRFAIAYLLALPLLVTALWPGAGSEKVRGREVALLAWFVVLSYALWQVMFSIQRYAIAIELLLPLLALVALMRLSTRYGRMAFVALALFLACTTSPANWGRLAFPAARQPVLADSLRQELSAVLDGAAVVLGPPPLAYLVPLLRNPEIAWFGAVFTEVDGRSAASKLATQERIFTISRPTPEDLQRTRELLGKLRPSAVLGTNCREFSTTLDPKLVLCPASPNAVRQIEERGGSLGPNVTATDSLDGR